MQAFCSLTQEAGRAVRAVGRGAAEARWRPRTGIERRGVILAFIMRLKQICNHPAHWLGDGAYAPEDSGKFLRLREMCEEIAARQEKALVFTQFREMTAPLAGFLEACSAAPGLVLHGGTRRQASARSWWRISSARTGRRSSCCR